MEWQSIETAPKDGIKIIAHNIVFGESVIVGWHKGNLDKDLDDVPHWSDVPNDNKGESLYFTELYFSHWMPLPPPPKE